ncbi:MAG: YdcF family protein, partial [Acidimicrobiales bacterium]
MRLVLKLVALVLGATVLYLCVTGAQVWMMSRKNEARPSQALVVMGSAEYNGVPSADLRARLDHALGLFRSGLAPTIVVTGGSEPGDRFSEAQVSADYLRHNGVPASRLHQVSGRNTWQSLSDAAVLLKNQGVTTVVLVSDPYHSARIGDISSVLGLTGYPSPTQTSPIKGISTVPYFAKETVGVALG